MNSLKKLSKTFLILVFFLALSSCKKEANSIDVNQPEPLKKEELIPYYVVVEHKLTNNKIGLIYFTKEGSSVKATFHGDGYSQTGDISVKDQGFSFDSAGDGNYIYSFSFDKNADGKLIMKSYQFTDKTSVSQGLSHAIIARKADAPLFENVNFETKEGILFKCKKDANNVMNVDWDIKERISYQTVIIPPNNTPVTIPSSYRGPEFSKPYTSLSGLGWKENEGILMGISVPEWKDTTKPLMLVEKGSTLYLSTKQ